MFVRALAAAAPGGRPRLKQGRTPTTMAERASYLEFLIYVIAKAAEELRTLPSDAEADLQLAILTPVPDDDDL